MTDTPTAISYAPFLDFARTARIEIDAALDGVAQYDDSCPASLREAIRYCLLAPGKRLRPLLVLMAAEACGCDRRQALPAACAVEMIHTYSLVHDDLPAMDDDQLRRGRPTCHVKYGEALAILVGDALLAQAFEVISGGIDPPERAARCCRELAGAAGPRSLVGGQVDDLQGLSAESGLVELERIHRRKTGAMFRVSLQLGAIIGDADARAEQALVNYGENLGLAFQIVDDLLDIWGSADSLGKSVGKDVAQGKRTYPTLLGEAASRQRAEQLLADARQCLTVFGSNAEPLHALTWYVLHRDH
jgi:geranylgeranyl diphosphate synthase, type II